MPIPPLSFISMHEAESDERARRAGSLLLAIAVAVRLVAAALVPLAPDETYYWDWSRHLAGGYFDHPPMIAVLDNNLYHQYAVLALVYDWSKRGTQNFPVIIPQELTPGTISVDWAGAVSAGGKSYEALKVVTADLEVTLLLDSSHRLMRLEVPAAKVSVVRE